MLPLLPSCCESSGVDSTSHLAFDGIELSHPEPPKPRPILSLKAGDQTLYVELVQIAETANQHNMAWVRPVLFVHRDCAAIVQLKVCAIAMDVDLLWPFACFDDVYAEDYLSLLSLAVDLEPSKAKLIVRAFIRQAWKLHWPTQAA
ncbi:MAG: hypothetical protein AAFY57_11790 [Cyanobacteria bacterium J06642_2]